MFAKFFFMTLYMQNILGYSPLQTGLRFLPTTLVIIVMGPLAGRLTDRVGPRPLMTIGLVVVAAALFIQSHITVHSGYGLLLPGFILMGFGMGLVMSPMSTAAMNAVDRTKAGVASGVLSMSRMVGGTFGRRRHGRARHRDRPLQAQPAAAAASRPRPAARSPTRSAAAPRPAGQRRRRSSPPPRRFRLRARHGPAVGAAVALIGAVVAWALIRALAQRRRAVAPAAAATAG